MAGPNPNYYARSGLLDFLTSDTSDDLTYRSSMLPIGTYRGSDGRERAGLAWPQLAMDAVDAMEAPGELLFGEGLDRDESQRRASIAAGLMMGGGLAAPRPGNALAMGGGRVVDDALPMDQASRMARADDLGYTLDAWHGTGKSNLTEFRPGTFFATDPKVASGFATNYEPTIRSYEMPAERNVLQSIYDKLSGNKPVQRVTVPDLKPTKEGASIYPVKINPEGFETLDWRQANGTANYDLGVDEFFSNNPNAPGVIVKNVLEAELGLGNFLHDQIVVRDPSRIRSVNAAFDPAHLKSKNILAANASPSTGLMSLYGYDDEYDPFLNY